MADHADLLRCLAVLSCDDVSSVVDALLLERPDFNSVLQRCSGCVDGKPTGSNHHQPEATRDTHGEFVGGRGSPLLSENRTGSLLATAIERRKSNPLSMPVAEIPSWWSIVFLGVFNVLMLTTVGIAYYMSIGTGRVSRKDFYISSSIDTGWSHRIGAFGMSIAFIAFIFVMCTRYVAVKAATADPFDPAIARRIHRLNRVAFCGEVLGALGGIGVAAFNYSWNFGVHYAFADDTFGCAVFSIWLQSWIDDLMSQYASPGQPTVQRRWRCCRRIQCATALLALIGMFWFGINGYAEFASLCELIMAVAIFSYYSTWVASAGTGYIVGVDLYVRFRRPKARSDAQVTQPP